MEFANKTQLHFQPCLSLPVAIDATGDQYTTPAAHRETLGDLARLSYLTGELRYTVRLNQATTGGAGVVKITDGLTVVASAPVDFSDGEELHGKINADLFSVNGAAELRVVLVVTEVADAATVAVVADVLNVGLSVVIGSCY